MDAALIDETCEQYLGKWRRLVSTTNWEKGAIIHAWRESLRESGALPAEFSDDAWSRRAGSVTPQHVGRLRRAYERFFAAREEYPGLYWSHFQAALDWDDAEMWLEGAVQSGWSISEMRGQRWEAMGHLDGEVPSSQVNSDDEPWDDDAEPLDASGEVTGGTIERVREPGSVESQSRQAASQQLDDDQDHDLNEHLDERGDDDGGQLTATGTEAPRPFANLPPLPPDVSDAFEAYKLCILRHKLAGWQEISRDDMLVSLDSLKQLALAPTDG